MRKSLALIFLFLLPLPAYAIEKEVRSYVGIVSGEADDKGPALVINPDGSINAAVTGAGSGGTSMTDDAAFTPGTGGITPMGCIADETAPDSIDEGDGGAVRCTLTRKQLMVLSDPTSEFHADIFDLTNSNPLATQLVDANGDAIVSFGGGTQYTEGDTDTTITGTALLMEGAANALVAAPGTTANGLLVDVSRIQGTVTVGDGAGALNVIVDSSALPTGAATSANQSTANTSLGNIDTSTSGLTGKFPSAATPADNMSNATTMTSILNRLMLFDGTNWDRAPGDSTNGALVNLGANNDVTVTSGNITADTELPAAGALADGAANPTAPAVAAHLMCFNGTTWDRCKSMGATATASPQVTCGTTSATLLASNASRFSADLTMIGSGTVYVCRSATCTTGTAAFIFTTQGQSYRETTYSGVFSCITATGSIAMAGSEITS